MPPVVSAEVLEELAGQTAERSATLLEKIEQHMDDMDAERRAWTLQKIHDFNDSFVDFLKSGSADAARPRLRKVCNEVVQSEISFEAFSRVTGESTSRTKLGLLELMPCEPEELARVYNHLDNYREAMLDEFTRAHAEYWKRRERAAARLHEDFFHHMPFPAITGTPDLVIEEMNPAVFDCMQFNRESLVGKHLREWLVAIQAPRAVATELIEKFRSEGSLVQEELHCDCPMHHGHPMVLLLSMNFIIDDEGNRIGFQAMVEDMSEQRALELKLAEEKAQLQSVFDSTPAGLIYIDPKHRIQQINANACRMFNLPPARRSLGAELLELFYRTSGSLEAPKELESAVREMYADPLARIESMIEMDDPVRKIQFSILPVRNVSDRPTGWLWIVRDATARLQAEQLKNDLTHMIVHDLKNPLTSITGGITLLRALYKDAEDQKARQALDLVERNSKRMFGMVMNLLDIERLEGRKLQLQRTSIGLAELLREAVEAQQLAAAERELSLEIDEKAKADSLLVDKNLVERVMTNLISNAIKHTRAKGKVVVRARATSAGQIRIEVADDGYGVAPQFHEKIFEKFGQAELRGQGMKTDTGLGLTFCKLAVEAHGGRIGVDSQAGEGATFFITLPRGTAAERTNDIPASVRNLSPAS